MRNNLAPIAHPEIAPWLEHVASQPAERMLDVPAAQAAWRNPCHYGSWPFYYGLPKNCHTLEHSEDLLEPLRTRNGLPGLIGYAD